MSGGHFVLQFFGGILSRGHNVLDSDVSFYPRFYGMKWRNRRIVPLRCWTGDPPAFKLWLSLTIDRKVKVRLTLQFSWSRREPWQLIHDAVVAEPVTTGTLIRVSRQKLTYCTQTFNVDFAVQYLYRNTFSRRNANDVRASIRVSSHSDILVACTRPEYSKSESGNWKFPFNFDIEYLNLR